MGDKSAETETLRRELVDLFKHIKKMRHEIAAIKAPQDRFASMTDELDAVVGDAASATNEIMANADKINDEAFKIQSKVSDSDVAAMTNAISDFVGNIIVACSFQDITGQRISKVVKALRYIETRIDQLISMWGQNSVMQEKVEDDKPADEYKKYLNGPQLPGQANTQADIDKMLNGATPTPAAPVAAAPAPKPAAPPAAAAPPPAAEPPAAMDQSSVDALFG
ncbi:hypothetical protein FACS1894186_5440 [Alphaproteobacteria bacterium]|nr:hypothetical protein FACS1894186_5440 [Alphaproteobacteria bacterium]